MPLSITQEISNKMPLEKSKTKKLSFLFKEILNTISSEETKMDETTTEESKSDIMPLEKTKTNGHKSSPEISDTLILEKARFDMDESLPSAQKTSNTLPLQEDKADNGKTVTLTQHTLKIPEVQILERKNEQKNRKKIKAARFKCLIKPYMYSNLKKIQKLYSPKKSFKQKFEINKSLSKKHICLQKAKILDNCERPNNEQILILKNMNNKHILKLSSQQKPINNKCFKKCKCISNNGIELKNFPSSQNEHHGDCAPMNFKKNECSDQRINEETLHMAAEIEMQMFNKNPDKKQIMEHSEQVQKYPKHSHKIVIKPIIPNLSQNAVQDMDNQHCKPSCQESTVCKNCGQIKCSEKNVNSDNDEIHFTYKHLKNKSITDMNNIKNRDTQMKNQHQIDHKSRSKFEQEMNSSNIGYKITQKNNNENQTTHHNKLECSKNQNNMKASEVKRTTRSCRCGAKKIENESPPEQYIKPIDSKSKIKYPDKISSTFKNNNPAPVQNQSKSPSKIKNQKINSNLCDNTEGEADDQKAQNSIQSDDSKGQKKIKCLDTNAFECNKSNLASDKNHLNITDFMQKKDSHLCKKIIFENDYIKIPKKLLGNDQSIRADKNKLEATVLNLYSDLIQEMNNQKLQKHLHKSCTSKGQNKLVSQDKNMIIFNNLISAQDFSSNELSEPDPFNKTLQSIDNNKVTNFKKQNLKCFEKNLKEIKVDNLNNSKKHRKSFSDISGGYSDSNLGSKSFLEINDQNSQNFCLKSNHLKNHNNFKSHDGNEFDLSNLTILPNCSKSCSTIKTETDFTNLYTVIQNMANYNIQKDVHSLNESNSQNTTKPSNKSTTEINSCDLILQSFNDLYNNKQSGIKLCTKNIPEIVIQNKYNHCQSLHDSKCQNKVNYSNKNSSKCKAQNLIGFENCSHRNKMYHKLNNLNSYIKIMHKVDNQNCQKNDCPSENSEDQMLLSLNENGSKTYNLIVNQDNSKNSLKITSSESNLYLYHKMHETDKHECYNMTINSLSESISSFKADIQTHSKSLNHFEDLNLPNQNVKKKQIQNSQKYQQSSSDFMNLNKMKYQNQNSNKHISNDSIYIQKPLSSLSTDKNSNGQKYQQESSDSAKENKMDCVLIGEIGQEMFKTYMWKDQSISELKNSTDSVNYFQNNKTKSDYESLQNCANQNSHNNDGCQPTELNRKGQSVYKCLKTYMWKDQSISELKNSTDSVDYFQNNKTKSEHESLQNCANQNSHNNDGCQPAEFNRKGQSVYKCLTDGIKTDIPKKSKNKNTNEINLRNYNKLNTLHQFINPIEIYRNKNGDAKSKISKSKSFGLLQKPVCRKLQYKNQSKEMRKKSHSRSETELYNFYSKHIPQVTLTTSELTCNFLHSLLHRNNKNGFHVSTKSSKYMVFYESQQTFEKIEESLRSSGKLWDTKSIAHWIETKNIQVNDESKVNKNVCVEKKVSASNLKLKLEESDKKQNLCKENIHTFEAIPALKKSPLPIKVTSPPSKGKYFMDYSKLPQVYFQFYKNMDNSNCSPPPSTTDHGASSVTLQKYLKHHFINIKL